MNLRRRKAAKTALQVIWKWKLEDRPAQTIEVPRGTRIIHTELDNGNDICLWGITNPAEENMEELQVAIVGTGWKIENLDDWDYIGTIKDIPYFWHIFVKRFSVKKIGETDVPYGDIIDKRNF